MLPFVSRPSRKIPAAIFGKPFTRLPRFLLMEIRRLGSVPPDGSTRARTHGENGEKSCTARAIFLPFSSVSSSLALVRRWARPLRLDFLFVVPGGTGEGFPIRVPLCAGGRIPLRPPEPYRPRAARPEKCPLSAIE